MSSMKKIICSEWWEQIKVGSGVVDTKLLHGNQMERMTMLIGCEPDWASPGWPSPHQASQIRACQGQVDPWALAKSGPADLGPTFAPGTAVLLCLCL